MRGEGDGERGVLQCHRLEGEERDPGSKLVVWGAVFARFGIKLLGGKTGHKTWFINKAHLAAK